VEFFAVGFTDSYDLLNEPFPIAPNVRIPVGAYDFTTARIGFTFGQQRPVSGILSAEQGTFYNGHRTTLGFSRPRVNLTAQLSLEPSVSINWIDLPNGSFTTKLAAAHVTYTMTPLMFARLTCAPARSISREAGCSSSLTKNATRWRPDFLVCRTGR
jgi:hypothetical protein